MTTLPKCEICKENDAPHTCPKCGINFCFVCSGQITEQAKLHSRNKGVTVPLCPKCMQPIEK